MVQAVSVQLGTLAVAMGMVVSGAGPPCEVGVMTRHDVMGAVLAERPERVVEGIDGYIALVECKHIGERYILWLGERMFDVSVADCVTSRPVGRWPEKGGIKWLGDVEKRLWEEAAVPGRPVGVLLCKTTADD